jgi:hypothetical protein
MRPIFTYFGLPTLFIMLCMTVVAWLRYVGDKKSTYKLYKWGTAWAVLGCFLLVVGLMGVINGVYYAVLAALTWKLVRLLSNNQALN